MIRAALRFFLRALLRIFFRRIETSGLDRLPATGPVVLVANHPSTLVDPILLLAFAPRPVSFLAKEPVFRMPVVGWGARALDSIPVYRAMDGADPRRNAETFSLARALLRRGGVLALFPEGTSHDDPRLKPLKSGAARIALGAASTGEGLSLSIVPAGLVFTDKRIFRSEVLLSFGAPIAVDPVALTPRGEPAPPDVRALTGRIQAGLDALVLQAESDGALALAAAAEQVLTGSDASTLAERVSLRQRLLAGRNWLAANDPARLERLERRVRRHLALLDATRLGHAETFTRVAAGPLARGALHLLLAPFALAGVVLHFAAWHAVDWLAHQFAHGDLSMAATLKLGFGLILYPATWIGAGVLAGLRFGAGVGLLAGVAGFFLAAAAVAFDEGSEPVRTLARATVLRLGHRGALERLRVEREALRAELLAAAELIPSARPT
jgi:glycerol-3-phosphate O-acyltransferase / dihydroxyacetone phosphate acyltransferase